MTPGKGENRRSGGVSLGDVGRIDWSRKSGGVVR